MSDDWSKLFRSILLSSIWFEADHVRLTWITMLALKDEQGLVEASLPGLAHEARVTLEQAEEAIATLQAPDKHSRTPDNEGRRIAKVDGGWVVLNHQLYQEKGSREDRELKRQKNRERVAKHRAKKANGGDSAPAAAPETEAPVRTQEQDAAAMAAARTAVPCLDCGLPARLVHGRNGDFYSHGKAGLKGCHWTCSAEDYQTAAAVTPAKLCSRCGERQVLGSGFEGGDLYCGPCQHEVSCAR